MSRTIAYLRISTSEQDTENQKIEITNYCNQQGLAVDKWIETTMSATKKSAKERLIDELLVSLKRGDTLIVSELSRLGRSIKELHNTIGELQRKKIYFHAIKQNMRFNGKLDMTQKVMLSMFSLFAELESDLISERTKCGLERARARGVILGNPDFIPDNKKRKANALKYAEKLRPTLISFIDSGYTQRRMVIELNNLNVKGRRGGSWSLPQLQRTLKRLNLKTNSTK